jgi:hypothetical protein
MRREVLIEQTRREIAAIALGSEIVPSPDIVPGTDGAR